MKTPAMNLDAYKMKLVQHLVQGIGRAQSKEEVRHVLFETIEDGVEVEDEEWATVPADLPPYTIEELHERIRLSEEDFRAGRTCTREEVHQRMLDKFPWLG